MKNSMNSNWLVRSRLKTRHLLLLVALDEQRNVHRASELLAMSQPAVSKLLMDLEEALQVQLFVRGSRGVTPTWYGETLIRHSRMVLSTLDKAHEEIQSRRAGLSGIVNIGTIVGPTTTMLPLALQEMNERFPKVQINVTMDLSNVLLAHLSAGKLDFVIGRLFEEDDKHLYGFERLGTEPLALVVRSGHPLAKAKNLKLDQVLKQSWVLPPSGGALRHQFDLAFRKSGMAPPKNGVETLCLSLLTGLLLSSDMVAILSTSVAEIYVKHQMFSYLPVEFNCNVGDYGLITLEGVTLSPSTLTFMTLLREKASSLSA
jgi:DNA-binding transcriptional LysR family regulator